LGVCAFFVVKNNISSSAIKLIRGLFENNIMNNKNINFNEIKNIITFNVLKTQAGLIEPDEDYLKYKKLFEDSLTEAQKREFVDKILNDKFTAKHLHSVDNSWMIGIYDVNLVVGLFPIPENKKQKFQTILKEYINLNEKASEKRYSQPDGKVIFTNIGICPKCMSNISPFATKCPSCTANLD
jgi:hypothetical protein